MRFEEEEDFVDADDKISAPCSDKDSKLSERVTFPLLVISLKIESLCFYSQEESKQSKRVSWSKRDRKTSSERTN